MDEFERAFEQASDSPPEDPPAERPWGSADLINIMKEIEVYRPGYSAQVRVNLLRYAAIAAARGDLADHEHARRLRGLTGISALWTSERAETLRTEG